MPAIRITQRLVLNGTDFGGQVNLYNATIRVLALSDDVSFPEGGEFLDLRECTVERFGVSEEQAKRFVEAQAPHKFSRDPYLQLEAYYERVGKDVQARDIHYWGRRALRENLKKEASSANWTVGRQVSDWFLDLLTGYGAYTGRVAWLIVIFVLVGAIIFSLDEILPVGEALGFKRSETSAATTATQDSSLPKPGMGDGLRYSVDRFIPVSLGAEEVLEPNQPCSETYGFIHAIAGWLLVPLFLASWSGLVRSR